MISRDGRTPVPLPDEQIFLTQEKVAFSAVCGGGYPGHGGASYKGDGIIYLTNQRVCDGAYLLIRLTPGYLCNSTRAKRVQINDYSHKAFNGRTFRAAMVWSEQVSSLAGLEYSDK